MSLIKADCAQKWNDLIGIATKIEINNKEKQVYDKEIITCCPIHDLGYLSKYHILQRIFFWTKVYCLDKKIRIR